MIHDAQQPFRCPLMTNNSNHKQFKKKSYYNAIAWAQYLVHRVEDVMTGLSSATRLI
jgi:hypothetical protein